jgi:hypothetical protein
MFMVVRDAFLQLGQSTTVAKLRQKLSLEVTQELFENYDAQYKMSSNAVLEETKRSKVLQTEYKKYEEKLKSTISALEQQNLVSAAKHIAAQHKTAMSRAKAARELYDEFKFMKGVSSVDAFQKKIQSSDYWGDSWAISTLERILGIKFVIISSEYAKKDENNMLQCGMNMDHILESRGSFAPEFYILTEHTGTHYRLISYKGKRIFTYADVPYDIKQLIVTKCIERNSGPFVLISEFKKLVARRSGTTDGQSVLDEDIIDTIDVDVLTSVDPHVVFQYYARAADKSAGRGAGEKIDAIERKLDFVELGPKGQFPNWRRKLDEDWLHADAPFELDGHHWNSVQHYVQAGKFKKAHPEFYANFTAESQSKIAGDVQLAMAAGSEKQSNTSGIHARPDNVVVDPTYPGKTEAAALAAGTAAKFTQIPHFTHLLLATKNAMLCRYTPGKKPEVAVDLIQIRKKLGS